MVQNLEDLYITKDDQYVKNRPKERKIINDQITDKLNTLPFKSHLDKKK